MPTSPCGRPLAPTDRTVVLRHAGSGRVLSTGHAGDAAIEFADRAEADRFRARWLDEPAGWELVPAGQLQALPAA